MTVVASMVDFNSINVQLLQGISTFYFGCFTVKYYFCKNV